MGAAMCVPKFLIFEELIVETAAVEAIRLGYGDDCLTLALTVKLKSGKGFVIHGAKARTAYRRWASALGYPLEPAI